MNSTPYEHSQVDAGNELGRRYITDFGRVESFYGADYRRPEDLANAASRQVNRTWRARYDRKALVGALQAYAERHPCPRPVLANIEKLADPGTVCVVSGQQAGLGGGPLLVLYKAMTAIRLAREVEQTSGQACVPVFWNASDDSDVEEVNRIRGIGADGRLSKFRFDIQSGRRHVRNIELPGPGDAQWEAAVAALGTGPFASRAAVLLRDAAGRDFGSAFTRLMLELLGNRGLIVVEPSALTGIPAWRRIHAFEIEHREENRNALRRIWDRLESQGLPPGVPVTNHLNLFVTEKGERRRVTGEGRRLLVEGREKSVATTALLSELKGGPGAFTPNVLLRPLVQNSIFPTVAYVAGQAEIAYHSLLKTLHRSARVMMPALFPRVSMTLLAPADVPRFDELVTFRQRLKWKQQEAEIAKDSAQQGVEATMRELRLGLSGLARPLEQDLQKLEQRTNRAVAEVLSRVKHDPLRLSQSGEEMQPLLNRYFPEDRPQERVWTLLSAYARYGAQLMDAFDGVKDIFDFQHHVAVMPELA